MSDVRGPDQDTVPQPGGLLVLKLAGAPAKVSLGILWNKMEPMKLTRVPDRVKEPLELAVAPNQELMGPLKQAGPQEPMGLLETMGPLELHETSGQEPMGPLEQAGL